MTSQGVMRAGNSGLSSHGGKTIQHVLHGSSKVWQSWKYNGNSLLSLTSTSKRNGGFICCVPDCFTDNKRNSEFSFYTFPNGESVELKELPKKWINLIA
jgi:hypothetical protein